MSEFSEGLYCGVLQKRLTKILDRQCPLKKPHKCMWVNVQTGKCAFSTDVTVEKFCKRVGIEKPTDEELESRKAKLRILLKPLETNYEDDTIDNARTGK